MSPDVKRGIRTGIVGAFVTVPGVVFGLPGAIAAFLIWVALAAVLIFVVGFEPLDWKWYPKENE